MNMGDETELNIIIGENEHEFVYGQFCSEEQYNRVRYDDNGQEYTVVMDIRRGQPKP
jgi:hypothetical protein